MHRKEEEASIEMCHPHSCVLHDLQGVVLEGENAHRLLLLGLGCESFLALFELDISTFTVGLQAQDNTSVGPFSYHVVYSYE